MNTEERRTERLNREALGILLVFFAVLAIGVLPFFCDSACGQESERICSEAIEQWEDVAQILENKIRQFDSIKRTPAARIIGKAVVKRRSTKTIAMQVSEALQAKEAVLDKKRDECRTVLGKEEQAFTTVSRCLDNGKSSEKRMLKRLKRNRSKLIKKTLISIAEVKEVKGSEDYAYYYNPSRTGYNPLMGGQNNYWRQQQQMFMNYWRRWGR
jgi:hypothetical protein